MKGLDHFFSAFSQFCRERDTSTLMNLNADGDISGWCFYEHEVFSSRDFLQDEVDKKHVTIKSADFEQTPVLFYGDDQTCCLVTEADIRHYLHDGSTRDFKGVRTSWFLEWHDGMWKVRHGHSSTPVSSADLEERVLPSTRSYGAEGEEVREIHRWLESRIEFLSVGNVEGLMSQVSEKDGCLFYGVCQGEVARSVKEYGQWYEKMFSEFAINCRFDTPIVFLSGDSPSSRFACVSCHGTARTVHKESGAVQVLQPVRYTFLLHKEDGKWLCRHSHFSVPMVEPAS